TGRSKTGNPRWGSTQRRQPPECHRALRPFRMVNLGARKFKTGPRPTGRGLTLLLIAVAAALCPAAAVRALGATHRPDPPTHLRATGVTRTALTLAWMRSTGPGRIARYRVFQDERRIGHTLGKTRFAVSGLRCGRTYSFSVRA